MAFTLSRAGPKCNTPDFSTYYNVAYKTIKNRVSF